MTSDDSDDEPLSILVEHKKLNPEEYVDSRFIEIEDAEVAKKRKKKFTVEKGVSVTINVKKRKVSGRSPPIIERPEDVWLYMKDFNTTGPYSCLLCPEWFINRAKIIVHYILNHKKDFCGICRYFVPDRDAWWAHLQFHTPWPCSQCVENFESEAVLRQHLSISHTLVHCRLCHFRVSDDDQYNTHLFQKHNVTNVSSKDEENLWELEYEGSPNFLCLLCSKSNNMSKNFFNHYMGFHHFTLKCFASVICGRDPPFLVSGADLRTEFIEGQLKDHVRVGYVDVDASNISDNQKTGLDDTGDSKELLKVLIPEIKQEDASGDEMQDQGTEENKRDEAKDRNELTRTYNGVEDFDVTLMELIVLQQCYFDYVNQTLTDINANVVPQISDIDYEKTKTQHHMNIFCPLCTTHLSSIQSFTSHMTKIHSVKSLPTFSCRVCATPFDTQSELDTHIVQELGDFDDLWICQFCDKEFDNRGETRRHLTEHVSSIDYDNCFSPHLGFKCRYCPTLFWNETDRETHQVRAHFSKHKEDYYNCDKCNEMFSDKVWFIHHYLKKHNTDAKVPIYLLKCCICCLVLPNVKDMREHFNKAHPEAKKVFCSLDSCKYKPLSHRKSFKLHLKTVHTPRPRVKRNKMECIVCGREFGSPRACSAHMAQVHGAAKFKCKLCAELLHTNDERKLHYLICHPGQHPFECPECGKSFQYKSSLYMHKQEHLPNKQTYKCTYCGKSFMKRDSYREHVLIHEGPRHACSYCPMRFVQRSNMLRHERRHTGERPYACPHCPRSFADKGACTAHARTHSRESSFACLYCGQTFVQKSKLTYHIRKHTGENLETCSVCSKLFTSACSLREHMKIHNTNKETVKCPLCDKKYQDERYMLRHLRTAHTRGQFLCPVCGKQLTSATGLRNHVVTHGAVKVFKCKQCPKTYSVKRTIIKHLRRRHGLKGTEINIKDFYKRLEPRECQLGLDDEMMDHIFGPQKKKTKVNDLLLGDFVTLTKNTENKGENEEENEDSESEDEISKDSEKDSDEEGKRPIKTERNDDSDQGELEPTDFVSVKIEPMDDDETA